MEPVIEFTKSKTGIVVMSATGLVILVLVGLWIYKRVKSKNAETQQKETGWFSKLFGKKN